MAWYNTKKELRTTENCYNYYGADSLQFAKLLNKSTSMAQSAVYRSVELISDAIGSIPIFVNYRDKRHNDVDTQHTLNMILDCHFLFIKKLIVDLLSRGNAYAFIKRDNNGDVVGLRYLSSNSVTINYDEKTDVVSYNCPLISGKKIEAINMIHLRKNTDANNVRGIGVFNYASNAIELAKNCDGSSNQYFSQGGSISGVLSVEGQLSNKQRDDIRSSWNQTFTDNGSGVAILPGNMTYTPIGSTLKDSQALEARQFNTIELSRFFGVQPWLLGAATTIGDIEAIQLDFYLHTLMPIIKVLEDEFNKKLLKPSERYVYVINFDDNYLIRTNKQAQANYVTTLVNNGLITLNEGRLMLGLNMCDNPEMDKHHIMYVDTNKTSIEKTENNNNEKENIEDAED